MEYTFLINVVTENMLLFSRSSRPEVFLGEGVLKLCSKFTGEHPCLIGIALWHGVLL